MTTITDHWSDAETITDPPVGVTLAEGVATGWNTSLDPADPTYFDTEWGTGFYAGWVRLVLSHRAVLSIDTNGSTGIPDTVLFVFVGTPTTSSIPLYENDDSGDDFWSFIVDGATAIFEPGVYYIAVMPYANETPVGDGTVIVRFTRVEHSDEVPPRPITPPSDVVFRVNGVDISHLVLISDAELVGQSNGMIGLASIHVLDLFHEIEYRTGEELTLDINGVRHWGGYVRRAVRAFPFPVEDTFGTVTIPAYTIPGYTIPAGLPGVGPDAGLVGPGGVTIGPASDVDVFVPPVDVPEQIVPRVAIAARYWQVDAVDYNVLFASRIVFDPANPDTHIDFSYPVGTYDDTIINDIFDNYLTEVASRGVSRAGVDRVDVVTLDIPGVTGKGTLTNGIGTVASAGYRWKEVMDVIVRATGALYYISPDKVLFNVDVDTPTATHRLRDLPVDLDRDAPFREFEILEDGMGLINDMLVWGAGAGASKVVFSRKQDAASKTAHGRWQEGLYTFGLIQQASADLVAQSYLTGSPQSKRGHKDDKVTLTLKTYAPWFRVGDKVDAAVSIFGFADVVPIRRSTIRFISPRYPVFELAIGHAIDEPWSIFEANPIPDIVVGELDLPKLPDIVTTADQFAGAGIIDSFSRLYPDLYTHDGAVQPFGRWGQGEHINWGIQAFSQNSHNPVEGGWGVMKNMQFHFPAGGIQEGDYPGSMKPMGGNVDALLNDGTPLSLRDIYFKFQIRKLDRVIPAALVDASGTNFYTTFDNPGNMVDYTTDAFGMPIPNGATAGGKGGGVPSGPSAGTITIQPEPSFMPATINGTIVHGDAPAGAGFYVGDGGGFVSGLFGGASFAAGEVDEFHYNDPNLGLHFNGGFSISAIYYTAKDERDAANWVNAVYFAIGGSGGSGISFDRHEGGSGAYGVKTTQDVNPFGTTPITTDGAILLDPDVSYWCRWYRPNYYKSYVKIWPVGTSEPVDWLATAQASGVADPGSREPTGRRLVVVTGRFAWQQWALAIDIIATGAVDPTPPAIVPGTGTGSRPVYPVYFDGTTYDLQVAFFASSSRVWVNGSRRRLNIDYTEDPSGGKIIFAATLLSTDEVIAYVSANGAPV